MSKTEPVKFTDQEIKFLNEEEICRLATASKSGELHVVPVSHLFHNGFIYIAVDYGTKKLKNLKENPRAAIVVDTLGPNRALMTRGPVKLIEKGEEYRETYKQFHSKFSWVRRAPWKEGEAPFVKITPTSKTSWGIRRSK